MEESALLQRNSTIGAARRQLLEDGYCLVDGRLPEGVVQKLSDWSDEWIRTTEHPSKWRYQGSDIFVSGINNPATHDPNIPRDEMVDFIIEHPAPIMAELKLADFRSQGIYQIISKSASAPALYWHQDWARWNDPISLSPWPQQLFLNWYLSDTSVANGCLRLIPGSHRRRLELHDHLIPPHESGGYEVDEANEWMFYDHPEAIDVPVTTGQLLIADARILHGTHPNTSDERRTVLLGWYFRLSNDVPDGWHGEVPHEILDRDPELPFQFIREPGEYLR